MTDINERLNAAAKPLQYLGNDVEALANLAQEAANEIGTLRGLLREAIERQESGQTGRSLYRDMDYLARVRRALND